MKLTQILLLLGSTLTSFLGLELFARHQVYQQTKLRPPLYMADPILGFRLKPNLNTFYQAPGQPSVPINISSQGLREDKIYSYQKPASTFRILMLGDSFTEGDEVPADQTFSKLLETKLNDQSDKQTYAVINAGVRGGSPLQYYLWLKTEGLKFNPDLIILNFYIGNDITDALMFDIATDSAGLATKLTLKDTYVDTKGYLRRLQTHFSFCELSAFCRLYLRPKPEASNWDSQSWQITQAHLLAINQLAQTHQAEFILTLIPQASQIDTPVHQILIDFAHSHNLTLIDFTPIFNQSMYDSFDQHWNQAGHQLAAQILYDYLLSIPEKDL